jgi:hypothetical protein
MFLVAVLWYPSHDEECFLLAEVYPLLVEAHSLLVEAYLIPISIQASAVLLYCTMGSHLSISLHRCQDKTKHLSFYALLDDGSCQT